MRAQSEAGIRARKLATEIGRMTPEHRQALADKMPAVCNPDGHFLTQRNTILLMMQSTRTDLTIVAGFRQWINAGRIVRKGEHSLGMIQVPLMLNKKDESGNAVMDSHGENEKALRFRWVPVFDVSQTDELKEPQTADNAQKEDSQIPVESEK